MATRGCITAGVTLGQQLSVVLGYVVPIYVRRFFCSDKCHTGHPETLVSRLSQACACLFIFTRCLTVMAARHPSLSDSHGCQEPITIWQSWLSDTHHHLSVMAARHPSPSDSHGCQKVITIWQSWLPDTHHCLADMAPRQSSPSGIYGCQTPITIWQP
jgi:hypothetical protein